MSELPPITITAYVGEKPFNPDDYDYIGVITEIPTSAETEAEQPE
jgi:hypothetical protein